MRQPIIFLMFPLFILFGCQQNSENKKDVRKQFYTPEGLLVERTFYEEEGKGATILTERTFKNDTIPHGYARSYYKSGQLMGEEFYKDGQQNGVTRQFNKEGRLIQTGWMKNGVLDSLGIMYFTDGQVKVKSFWDNGKQLGEQLYYNSKGVLSKYLLYDPVGELVYRREYKEDGELLNEEGSRNTQLIYKGEDDIFAIGEMLSVKIYAPTPPDCEASLFVSIKDESGKSVVDKKNTALKSGSANYNVELKEVGKYYFETTINFKDLATGEQEEYDNAFEYSVIN